MTDYNKKFLTFDEQIGLLEDRGLIIDNKEKLLSILKHVSYYHLSIYCKAFQNENDQFKDGTTLQNVWDVYNFDKKLRLLLLDVLERIETSLKCILIYEISKSKNDNYWYSRRDNYIVQSRSEEKKKFEKFLEYILNNIKFSQEIYIQHYYNEYSFPKYPPSWMFFEDLSFGKCVKIVRNLNDSEENIIASFYQMNKKSIQMLHRLSVLRNSCAHHSRIWNRNFTMKMPKYNAVFNEVRRNSLFAYVVAIQIFFKKINPKSNWLDRLEDLISEYNVEIYRMGFPHDWKDRLKSII